MSRQAARRVRRRRAFIPVTDTLQAGETAPRTVCSYVARVAQVLTHRAYHFPGAALQYIAYLTWLLERADARGLSCVRALDTQARTQMSLVPEQYLTPVALQHFVLSADARARDQEGTPRSERRVPTGPTGQVCFKYNRSACQTPCLYGRRHVCNDCESPSHRAPACPRPKNGALRRAL